MFARRERHDLDVNRMLVLAATRLLEIVGEAASPKTSAYPPRATATASRRAQLSRSRTALKPHCEGSEVVGSQPVRRRHARRGRLRLRGGPALRRVRTAGPASRRHRRP